MNSDVENLEFVVVKLLSYGVRAFQKHALGEEEEGGRKEFSIM